MGAIRIPKKKHFRKAADILKQEGMVTLMIVALQRIKKQRQRTAVAPQHKLKFSMLVKGEDAVAARWVTNPYRPTKTKTKAPYTINWVMSPPGPGGGGHQNIFRFIKYLEGCGHTCRVYLYSAHGYTPVSQIQDNLSNGYAQTEAAKTIEWLDGPMEKADVIFATGWETAYPVFNDPSKARRFYFVQDFEPTFYPVGSEYVLAENTYKFGFYGITAGGWLSSKLQKEYGMQCTSYDFAADASIYSLENPKPRKEVFFYARPVTARRGFELGVMALQIFHEQMPDYKIVFAGWDVGEYDIPFPYENRKTVTPQQLAEIYNRSATGLIMSLTNMSLLPLEVLACGLIPVVNDADNNRMVSNNPFIVYAQPSPDALAQAMIDVVKRKDLQAHAKKAAASVQGWSWEKSGAIVDAALKKQLND